MLVCTPLVIVPLTHASLKANPAQAPRTALFATGLPLIASLLAGPFGHVDNPWSVILTLTFGALAWLTKAGIGRPARVTAIEALGVSSLVLWCSPTLWQSPTVTSWHDALTQALMSALTAAPPYRRRSCCRGIFKNHALCGQLDTHAILIR